MPALCGCVRSDVNASGVKDRLQNTLEEAADQLSNNTSESYYAYGPDQHGFVAEGDFSFDGSGSFEHGGSYSDEKAYCGAFADELAWQDRNGDFSVFPSDVWIIVDGDDAFGYGQSHGRKVTLNSGSDTYEQWINTGRALSCAKTWAVTDPNRLTKSIIRHNLVHCYLRPGTHKPGSYRVNNNNEVHSVSALAMGYVQAQPDIFGQYKSDTTIGGSDDIPDSFDGWGGKTNYVDKDYCGAVTDWCRHSDTFTQESMDRMEAETPKGE